MFAVRGFTTVSSLWKQFYEQRAVELYVAACGTYKTQEFIGDYAYGTPYEFGSPRDFIEDIFIETLQPYQLGLCSVDGGHLLVDNRLANGRGNLLEKMSVYEESGLPPGDIGTGLEIIHCRNDRLIYAWQSYARKYDAKTVDSHLAAIRDLETFLHGKPFDKLTRDDLASYRDHQGDLLKAEGQPRRCRSTVSHRLSHLRAFVTWLRMQDGYKRLPEDLAAYLELPRSSLAKGLAGRDKEQPTIDEAEDLLRKMPDRTLKERRAQALSATAFLGALRAGTLISLQIKHVQVENRRILQDPTASRVKNGKALVTQWFPIPVLFEQTLIAWLAELESYGCTGEDALFPDLGRLSDRRGLAREQRAPIAAMTSQRAVTEAFKTACDNHAKPYTPHSARRTIAGLGNKRQLTNEERKAWSLNMGHEKEQTTDIYYATIEDERRFELVEGAHERAQMLNARELSEKERLALIDDLIMKLTKKE